jgi:hypothetical protein
MKNEETPGSRHSVRPQEDTVRVGPVVAMVAAAAAELRRGAGDMIPTCGPGSMRERERWQGVTARNR